jgi:hypothetical protein
LEAQGLKVTLVALVELELVDLQEVLELVGQL